MSRELTYKEAGVDIDAADAFVKRILPLCQATHDSGVLPGGGAFAGLYRPARWRALQDPVIAATCDGVGTKLLIAHAVGSYAGLGQDLVGMNVNDLLPCGAQPMLFLDYIACGALQPTPMADMVAGMASACRAAGCALLGGETAEMPDVYKPREFDLAGFAVGLCDGAKLPKPHTVRPGDVALALPAVGVHANGLSLARKALFERGGLAYDSPMPGDSAGRSIGEVLLVPTPIYVRQVMALHAAVDVKAAAHITGGGIAGRGRKLGPEGLTLELDRAVITPPAIFSLIAERGGVAAAEMRNTFNMGYGFVVIVDARAAAAKQKLWAAHGFVPAGEVVAGPHGVSFV